MQPKHVAAIGFDIIKVVYRQIMSLLLQTAMLLLLVGNIFVVCSNTFVMRR